MKKLSTLKKEIYELAKQKGACDTVEEVKQSKTKKQLLLLIKENIYWCILNGVVDIDLLLNEFGEELCKELNIFLRGEHYIICKIGVSNIVTFGSSSANVKTFGSNSANVKTFGSSSANVETFGSSSANVKTFGSSSANVETWDSSSANVETWDSSSAINYSVEDNSVVIDRSNQKIVTSKNKTYEIE